MIDLTSINEYYILKVALAHLLSSPEIVGTIDTVRHNLARTEFVVKTKNLLTNCSILSEETIYSHEEIKIEMAKPEWTDED